MLKGTRIYSCFSGSGKTFAQSRYSGRVLDLESSYYRYRGLSKKTVEALKGDSSRELNENFVDDYVDAILDSIGSVDILFISQHDEVLEELDVLGVPYTIVFYESDMKDECLSRCKQRGNSSEFIEGISDKWDYFCDKYQVEGAILLSHERPFISDWLLLD